MLSPDHHRPVLTRFIGLRRSGIHQDADRDNCVKRVFLDFGVPEAIRTNNGLPFASPNALFGLSRLSIWWLRLGVRTERIKPGQPEQNGRICIGRRKINLSTVFAGQSVDIRAVADNIWLVSFMDYDLGFFDEEALHH